MITTLFALVVAGNLLAAETAQECLPNDTALWEIGKTGTLPRERPNAWPPRVLQVLDKQNLLLDYYGTILWLEGVDTTGLVDEACFSDPYVFRVNGKRRYATADGGSKMVWGLVPTNAEEVKRLLAENFKRSDAERLARLHGAFVRDFSGDSNEDESELIPTLSDISQGWQQGDIGRVRWYGIEVLQVLDEKNVLVKVGGAVIWIEGINIMDDSVGARGRPKINIDDVYKVGTRGYETTAGTKKTVWTLTPWKNEKALAEFRELLAEAKIRRSAEKAAADAARQEAARQARLRKWSDASGAFTVVAEFRGYANGNVSLRREDGREVSVSLARLSEEDRKWVRQKITPDRGKSREAQLAELRKKISADEKTLEILEARITQLSENNADEKKLGRSRQEREKTEQRISDAKRKIEQLESGRDSP